MANLSKGKLSSSIGLAQNSAIVQWVSDASVQLANSAHDVKAALAVEAGVVVVAAVNAVNVSHAATAAAVLTVINLLRESQSLAEQLKSAAWLHSQS